MIILQYNHYCLISEEKIEFFFISRPLNFYPVSFVKNVKIKSQRIYNIYLEIQMFVFARKDMFSRHSVVEKNDKIRKAKQIL